MHYFEECLLLDADDLPTAVHISPLQPGHDPTVIDILYLFDLESNKLGFLARPAPNASGEFLELK